MEFKKYRVTGELSDITVIVNKQTFMLHKFPLYTKSDFFKALARSSMNDSNHVELNDFPGGAATFSSVADFCYNLDIQVSPKNVAQLRCAAEYLQMTSPGNLSDQTDEYLHDVMYTAKMTSMESVVQILRGCCSVGPVAEQANITGKCIDALVEVWKMEDGCKKAKDAISDSVLDKLTDIPLCWFLQLLIMSRDRGVSSTILALLARKYVWSVLKENQLDMYDTIDGILLELPAAAEALQAVVNTEWVITVLKTATQKCKSQSIILELASNMLRKFTVRDLMQFPPNLLRELVQYASNSEKCIPDISCDVIDRYLHSLALDQSLSTEVFMKLATCLPVDFRTSHDLIFQVVELLFKSGTEIPVDGRKAILELVDFRRLSEDTLRRAYETELVPLSYITKASLSLCTKLRAELETAKNIIKGQQDEFRQIYQCVNVTDGTWMKNEGNDFADVQPLSRDKMILQVSHVKERSPVAIEMTHEFIEGKLAVCALAANTCKDQVLYLFNPFKSQLLEIQTTCDGKSESFKIENSYRKFETTGPYWPYSPRKK